METVTDLFEAIQRGLSQQGRLLKLDTVLGKDVLLPHRLVAQDRLGRGYTYTLDVVSLKQGIELKQLIAQPVTLWIQQTLPASPAYLPVHGYVHRFSKLGLDGQFAHYQLSFSSWLHLLTYRQDARIWQDKSADDILKEVFNQHPEAQGRFRFVLARPAVLRSYCTQYETDWHFVMRLMEEEGWYCYHEQHTNGRDHTVIITDTVHHLPSLSPPALAFQHGDPTEPGEHITQWSSERQLISTTLKTVTFDYKAPHYPKEPIMPISAGHGAIPSQLEVFHYSGAYRYQSDEEGSHQARNTVEEWQSSAKRYFATSSVRRVAVGYCFTLTGHTDHDRDPPKQREFVILSVEWFMENNLPLGTLTLDFPGSLHAQLAQIKQQTAQYQASTAAAFMQTYGATATPAACSSAQGFCLNQLEVQRSLVAYRSPIEHPKPVMQPQTALVVGPEKEEIYTDALNRVKVKFIWDHLNPANQTASCWVRVSYPQAGNHYGAVYVPRIHQEVIVSFLDANPDRPIITGCVYNGHHTPAWHSNGYLSGMKSKEYQGSGYNQLVFDDTFQQNRVQLSSSYSQAQLNLGYLVAQQGNQRQAFYGTGFALHTQAYGAVTAGQGLYLSSYAHSRAEGEQLAVKEAHQQLQYSHQLTHALSASAIQAQAEPLAGQPALQAFIEATQDSYPEHWQKEANRFKEPILLAASPSGIGLTTPKSIHLHSGEHLTLSSGEETNLAVGKSLVASIKEKLSLFVYHAGMKLFAAKGKVEIQAQSDDLDIIAEKVLRLISTTDKIELWAKKEILLGAGGSAIKINEEGITDITTGQRIMHHSAWSMPGPKSLAVELPQMPSTFCEECALKASQGAAFIME